MDINTASVTAALDCHCQSKWTGNNILNEELLDNYFLFKAMWMMFSLPHFCLFVT